MPKKAMLVTGTRKNAFLNDGTGMSDNNRKAVFMHRLAAGTGMVLLALVWAAGWFTGADPFIKLESASAVMGIVAAVFAAWNLLAGVIAAGFFHAASVYPAASFRKYQNSSLRLVVTGIIFLFPVPIAAQVLGNSPWGRALALVITGISICAIIFGRARLRLIESRLNTLAEGQASGSMIEEIEQLGESEI